MKEIRELRELEKEELIEYVQELQQELEDLKKHNIRGAGRKEKFTDEQIKQILDARKEGKSIRAIAIEFGCSVGLVHKIVAASKR